MGPGRSVVSPAIRPTPTKEPEARAQARIASGSIRPVPATMTALEKYARLEAPGVWRSGPDAQRRDVVVSLGNASLILCDSRSGAALSHWSLRAVRRLNRGTSPAIYSPDPEDDGETLEISDPTLIEALSAIRAVLTPKPPLRWLRTVMLAGSAALVIGAVLWLPGLMAARTARLVPDASRVQIGREAFNTVFASTTNARICTYAAGREALAALRNRVLGSQWRVSVVAGIDGFKSAHFPGRLIVLGDDLLTRLDSPDALAGWLITEAHAAEQSDPLLDLLSFTGSRATFSLLTTGDLPDAALVGYGAVRLSHPPALPDPEYLVQQFGTLNVSPLPYADSIADTVPDAAQTLHSRVHDQPGAHSMADMLIGDGQWLTLQNICAN